MYTSVAIKNKTYNDLKAKAEERGITMSELATQYISYCLFDEARTVIQKEKKKKQRHEPSRHDLPLYKGRNQKIRIREVENEQDS